MRAWGYLLLAIVAEVAATLSLKGALTHPWLYVVVVGGYVGAFSSLYLVLRAGLGVGTAYGVWGAVGVVATAGFSHVLFGESLTWPMRAGMALIIVGVACVELGSEAPADPEAAA
ncbi:SMR family transporter [uncultured Corynebacterium sp.]|uniref:DMT family transporter n=1 Tax=uncultured Corynebacterium sp. TaxID=159447 RepID=UPI0025FE1A7D|nr:SMR family transporter [uncultured Corynebacterium sp.]